MIAAPWGDEKTGKSSFALTFPKPIWHADMDFGFHRVTGRFKKEIESGLIVSKPYPIPVEELMFSSQIGRPIKGVREVYEEFLHDFVNEFILNPDIPTGVIDTHTQLWEIVRLGFLQEKQELQEKGEKLRERLMPYEYGEPNDRMKRIIQAARSYGKHLVMVHYAKEEYKPMLVDGTIKETRTGKAIMDSFKHIPDLSDIVIQTSRNGVEFYGEVVLCGLDIRMEGMKFRDPSYDIIVAALERLKG